MQTNAEFFASQSCVPLVSAAFAKNGVHHCRRRLRARNQRCARPPMAAIATRRSSMPVPARRCCERCRRPRRSFATFATRFRACANADDHVAVYGAGQGLRVRLRAYNTSGPAGATMFGEWSAPTLLCCAAATVSDLQPTVEAVIPGASFSLVEWRVPSVRQPDGSPAIVGGLHSYSVAGTLVVGGCRPMSRRSRSPRPSPRWWWRRPRRRMARHPSRSPPRTRWSFHRRSRSRSCRWSRA
jgi:hypothetical protein